MGISVHNSREYRAIIIDNFEGYEPLAYNIDRKFLRSSKIEKEFDIFFGEDKPLVEWLTEEEFDNIYTGCYYCLKDF